MKSSEGTGWSLQDRVAAYQEREEAEKQKKDLSEKLLQINEMNEELSIRVKMLQNVHCEGCSRASSSSHVKAAIASSPGGLLSSPAAKTLHSRGGSTSHFLNSMQMNNSVIEEED